MADAVVTVCLADEFVEDWDVLQLLHFDFEDMLNLLVWFPWIFSVIMLILMPVSPFLSTVLHGLLFREAIILAIPISIVLEIVCFWIL